jgi:hypothetical protein
MGFFVNGKLSRYGALMSELYPTKALATGEERSQVLARKLWPLKAI